MDFGGETFNPRSALHELTRVKLKNNTLYYKLFRNYKTNQFYPLFFGGLNLDFIVYSYMYYFSRRINLYG